MVGPDGLEPSTPRLSSACSNQLSYEPKTREGSILKTGGADRIRTGDPLLAKQMLYQLSYDPPFRSSRQNKERRLEIYFVRSTGTQGQLTLALSTIKSLEILDSRLLRKEVIQPQVPLRLPCYDFVPITSLTLGRRPHCWLANALRAKPAFMT